MKYLKLLKVMYLIDREALARWGRPLLRIIMSPWTKVRYSAAFTP